MREAMTTTPHLLDGWWWNSASRNPDAAAHRLWQVDDQARTLCGVRGFSPIRDYARVPAIQAYRSCRRCEVLQHRYTAK